MATFNSNSKALLRAARNGHTDKALTLIDRGAYVNSRDFDDATPLHCAAERGDTEVVVALLNKGADVRARDSYDLTPLHCAARGDIALALILNGADVNGAGGKHSRTPLHFATERGRADVVKTLLDEGADVDARDNMGSRPLHNVARNGNTEITHMLIERGADACNGDAFGLTPLHYSAHNSHAQITLALIEAGADVNVRDDAGSKPLDIATGAGCTAEIARILDLRDENKLV